MPTSAHLEQGQHASLRAVVALGTRAFPGPGAAPAPAMAPNTTGTGGAGSAPTTLDATGSLHHFPGLEWMLASADFAATLQAPAETAPHPAALLPRARFLGHTNSTPSSGGSITEGLTGLTDLQDAIAGLSTMALNVHQHDSPCGQLPTASAHTMGLSHDVPMWDLLASTPPTPVAAVAPAPPLAGSGLRGAGAASSTAIHATAPTAAGETASLYVCGLPPDTTELLLYQIFAPHGAVQSCRIKTDPGTALCTGVAFVNYVRKDDAQRTMHLLDCSTLPCGRQLHITRQAPRKVRAASAASKAAAATLPRQQQQLHRQLRQTLSCAAKPPQPEQQQQLLLRDVVTGVQPVVVTWRSRPAGTSPISEWIVSQQDSGDVVGASQPPTMFW